MGGKCVKLCTAHVSVCVCGGRSGGKVCEIVYCTCECVCGGSSGGKCVKLCTVHVSGWVGGSSTGKVC